MSKSSMLTVSAAVMSAMATRASANCLKAYYIEKAAHVERLEIFVADEQKRRNDEWDKLGWWGKFNNLNPATDGKVLPVSAYYGNYHFDTASAETEHTYTDYLPYFVKVAETTERAAFEDSDATLSISIHNFNLIDRYANKKDTE